MKRDQNTLVPGSICDEHFQLLLEGTSIRASGIVHALRDHLVHGVKKSEAVKRNKTSFPQFSVRLSKIRDEHRRINMISKFYQQKEIESRSA